MCAIGFFLEYIYCLVFLECCICFFSYVVQIEDQKMSLPLLCCFSVAAFPNLSVGKQIGDFELSHSCIILPFISYFTFFAIV